METKTLTFCSRNELEQRLKSEVIRNEALCTQFNNAKKNGMRVEFWAYLIDRSNRGIEKMKKMLRMNSDTYCYSESRDKFELYTLNKCEL